MQIFDKARLKLTLWYLLIIAIISLSFSFVIYRLQTSELTRFEQLQRQRIEEKIEQGMGLYQEGPRTSFIYIDTELIDAVKKRILFTLAILNGSVLVFSAVLGYFLAGRTLTPIKEMVDEQERFVQDASHELRTPLTVLRTTLEVFARSKSKSIVNAEKVIKNSLSEVVRLQKLSDYLLELSMGKKELELKKLKLKQLVVSNINYYAPFAKKKNILLVNQVADYLVLGEETTFLQLLSILTDNALKYTKAGGRVIFSSHKVGKKVFLSIKDTGVGIKASELPHIFDRFYRADSARTKGGYGLGLAIARNIAKNHGGTLSAESKVGIGSTFTLTLPRL